MMFLKRSNFTFFFSAVFWLTVLLIRSVKSQLLSIISSTVSKASLLINSFLRQSLRFTAVCINQFQQLCTVPPQFTTSDSLVKLLQKKFFLLKSIILSLLIQTQLCTSCLKKKKTKFYCLVFHWIDLRQILHIVSC